MPMTISLRAGAAALLLAVALPLMAAPIAYVPNEKSGTLSLIDTADDHVIAEIPVGKTPRGIAASPDGKKLYVSDQPNSALVVVDLASRTVAGSIALGESPEGVAASPDGKWVAAAVEISNSVALIDTATGTKIASIPTLGKNPEHAVF